MFAEHNQTTSYEITWCEVKRNNVEKFHPKHHSILRQIHSCKCTMTCHRTQYAAVSTQPLEDFNETERGEVKNTPFLPSVSQRDVGR